jgi:hypothetical protein
VTAAVLLNFPTYTPYICFLFLKAAARRKTEALGSTISRETRRCKFPDEAKTRPSRTKQPMR